MIHRGLIFAAVAIAAIPAPCADSALRLNRAFGGSNFDSVAAIATDSNGFVITAGSTASYDFPVTDASINRGTHFAETLDAGRSWHPLSNLPAGTPWVVAAAPGNPPVWYAGGPAGLFKSVDGGATWSAIAMKGIPACDAGPAFCGISIIAIDPANPATLYVVNGPKIAKTTDAGATWSVVPLVSNTPTPPSYFFIDPTHPDHLYTSIVGNDYRSVDGGQTWIIWTPGRLHPNQSCPSTSPMAFDSGTLFIIDHCDLFRSTDDGVSWIPMPMPAAAVISIAAVPGKPGSLYVTTGDGVYGTTDAAEDWAHLLSFTQNTPLGSIAIDPSQPANVIAGNWFSNDSGRTWTQFGLGRGLNSIAFDPKRAGHAVAATPGASPAFVAKLNSAGAIFAATYFGGAGATNIKAVAVDPAGNIYITGNTNSPEFPVTPGALTATPGPVASAYAASFDPQLNLRYATFLPDGTLQALAIAVDAAGSPAVAGYTIGPGGAAFVIKLKPDFTGAIFSTRLTGSNGSLGTAIASDDAGNTVAAGVTGSHDFPLAGAGAGTKLQGFQDGFVARFDPSGKLLYSGYLGGSDGDWVSGVALDSAGNIYVTGNTASKDFPVTAGAYQKALSSNCPYPSSVVNTGFIGVITERQTDDGFIVKLDPDGNLLYATYLGAGCYDVPHAIAVDTLGHAWIAGYTNSSPFPQVMPFQSGPGYASYQAFVSELDANGSSLLFSSYIDAGANPSIAVDVFGNVYIGGDTTPPPPAVFYGVYQGLFQDLSGVDATVAKIQTQFPAPLTVLTVGNAFTLRSGPVSPGQITLVTAAGLTPDNPVDLTLTPSAPLPRSLAGAQVLFDGEPAAIVSVAPGKAVAVAPYDLAGKQRTSVQLVFQDAVSAPVLADVAADHGYLSADGSGSGQFYARNPDGTLNSPQNPAPQGSLVTVYLTGVGVIDPTCPEGGVAAAATPLPATGYSTAPGMLCGIAQTLVQAPSFTTSSAGVIDSALTFSVK